MGVFRNLTRIDGYISQERINLYEAPGITECDSLLWFRIEGPGQRKVILIWEAV